MGALVPTDALSGIDSVTVHFGTARIQTWMLFTRACENVASLKSLSATSAKTRFPPTTPTLLLLMPSKLASFVRLDLPWIIFNILAIPLAAFAT